MGDSKQMNRLLCFIYFLLMGDFLPCTARKIRKICVDSEMEIFSRHGVKIEPYEKSHVELQLLDPVQSSRKFQIQMEFKTYNPNGILFYGRSRGEDGRNSTSSRKMNLSDELIAITLQDGDLIYKVKCPTLHADLYIPTHNMTRLNDGRWHKISYSVKYKPHGQYGFIAIDGMTNSKRYEVTCKRMTSIVVGGHSPKDTPYITDLHYTPGHFDGCIRNLQLPSPLLTPPKYYAVSVCE